MGAARGIWEAAKHPRGYGGRFGSSGDRVVIGRFGKSKKRPQDEMPTSKRDLRTMARLEQGMHANPRTQKHTSSMIRWRPTTFGARGGPVQDARLRLEYHRGTLGPWQPRAEGGMHRPVIEPAGWHATGLEVRTTYRGKRRRS